MATPNDKPQAPSPPRVAPPAAPASPAPARQDFTIPPPVAAPAAPATGGVTAPGSAGVVAAPYASAQPALSTTQIAVGVAGVLAWAGLLLLVKRLVTNSLVGQFADLGRARAAGTTLYLFLLVLGATIILCAVGGFWTSLVIVAPAAVLNLMLLVLCLVTFGSARASRQRR